ncbi:MAG: 4-alpha-glucanotransferase, partial [Muribaculaceae bacterium]|nr:4-alpha-glucanotransferase [Muribaculaceae bacterium]
MKIKIHIAYHTQWGEALYISGSIPQLGAGDPHKAPMLEMTAPDLWSVAVDVPASVKNFTYRFIVKAENKAWREEWGAPHRFEAADGISAYDIHAYWQDVPNDKPYWSSAFVDGMLSRNFRDQPLAPK